jgi:hypothetical protein
LSGAGILLVSSGAGCLDAGPPPTGRHLLSGRDPDAVQLVPGPTGGPTRIVLSQQESADGGLGFTTVRISTVDDPVPAGGPVASSRTLLDGSDGQALSCTGYPCTLTVDTLGRLYLAHVTLTPSTVYPGDIYQTDDLVRVDPETGAQQSFGVESDFLMSADRTRFAFLSTADQTSPVWTIAGVDGDETTVTGATGVQFIGDNDLFFVTADLQLMHLPPGADAPASVAANVDYYDPYDTQRGPLLLLERSTAADTSSYVTSYVTSLFDVPTLTETALPPTTAMARVSPSPSGRYLTSQTQSFYGSSDSPTIATVFDRDTGQEVTTSIAPGSVPPALSWRPQHDEVWYGTGADLWRWPPDGPPAEFGQFAVNQVPGPETFSEQELGLLTGPAFTPDGRFFFYTSIAGDQETTPPPGPTQSADDVPPPVFTQSADDATAAPCLLNPAGTVLAGVWALLDGRLLVEASLSYVSEQNDIYLVDPAARTARALATRGHVIATGHDRFLALLHWLASGSGDLTLIDYATGAETLIAQNVFAFAIDMSPVVGDALGPGTRVVYLVRNRIASPYDGLWAIDLP